MVVIAYSCYDLAGQLTRWLYEHDVFILLCFVFILWGISYFPVWIVDWSIYRINRWADKTENEVRADEYGNDYIDYK